MLKSFGKKSDQVVPTRASAAKEATEARTSFWATYLFGIELLERNVDENHDFDKILKVFSILKVFF